MDTNRTILGVFAHIFLHKRNSLQNDIKDNSRKHMVLSISRSAYKEKAMVIIPDKTIHPSHILLWFMGMCNRITQMKDFMDKV